MKFAPAAFRMVRGLNIRNCPPQLLIDGKEIPGVTDLKISIDPNWKVSAFWKDGASHSAEPETK